MRVKLRKEASTSDKQSDGFFSKEKWKISLGCEFERIHWIAYKYRATVYNLFLTISLHTFYTFLYFILFLYFFILFFTLFFCFLYLRKRAMTVTRAVVARMISTVWSPRPLFSDLMSLSSWRNNFSQHLTSSSSWF